MKKGILWVPEWAKEAFRNGAVVICMDFGAVNQSVVKYNQQQVELEPSLIGNAYVLGGGESFVPKEWIEPIEDPINWKRLEMDCPLRVQPLKDGKPFIMHFAKYDGGLVYFWNDGKTSWTGQLNDVAFKAEDCSFIPGVNPEDHYKADGEE
jgi:hypothetical protein